MTTPVDASTDAGAVVNARAGGTPPPVPGLTVDWIRAALLAGAARPRHVVVHEAWYYRHWPSADQIPALDVAIDQLDPTGDVVGVLGEWHLTFDPEQVRLTVNQWAWPAFVACEFSRILANVTVPAAAASSVVRLLRLAGYRDATPRETPNA